MSSDKNVQKKEPVKIREKKLANGNVHLFLDIYYNGKAYTRVLEAVPYSREKSCRQGTKPTDIQFGCFDSFKETVGAF